jgi:hypothetical protein
VELLQVWFSGLRQKQWWCRDRAERGREERAEPCWEFQVAGRVTARRTAWPSASFLTISLKGALH